MRQLLDVPEVRVRVTAHLLLVLACAGCGVRTRATAPAGVSGPAVYGPTVTMLVGYLAAQHHIPVAGSWKSSPIWPGSTSRSGG